MIHTNPKILDERAKLFMWGTYGIDGKQPLTWKPIESLKTDHLEAILITQYHLELWHREVILHILKARYKATDVETSTIERSIDLVGTLQPQLP